MTPLSFPSLGVLIPEIYLPRKDADRNKRAVVACDQYTSQLDYWEAVEKYVGDQPSTYRITFPEVYLHQEGSDQRISEIQQHMKEYLEQGILENKGNWLIFIDRQTSYTSSRKGLMLALDLEHYDYRKGSQTLIRASEGTVVDRLPPRIKIRQGATLESPHILVLIDDPEQQVIEPLAKRLGQYQKLYDFDLMMDGGHITGYHITDEASIQGVIQGLERLADKKHFKQKYGVSDEAGVLLFAMGDGNHSFATAKAIREEKKKSLSEQEQLDHPARFALVELNNIHDEGISFEPIHRVLFNVDTTALFQAATKYFTSLGSELKISSLSERVSWNVHHIQAVTSDGDFLLTLHNPKLNLEVGNLQIFLDQYLKDHPETKIDYLHGKATTEELGRKVGNIGFFLPVLDKSDFFTTVIKDGVLPRKTFSMGEAEEKRFYVECRKIV